MPVGGRICIAIKAGVAMPCVTVCAMPRPSFIISACIAAWRLQNVSPTLIMSKGVGKGVICLTPVILGRPGRCPGRDGPRGARDPP